MEQAKEVELKEQEEKFVTPVLEKATALTVVTAEDYTSVGGFLKEVKSAQAGIKKWFAPLLEKTKKAKAAATAAHSEATSKETESLQPLVLAEVSVKNKMLTYEAAQREIAREKQEKLQKEMDRKADQEKERLRKKAILLKTTELREERLEEVEEVVAPIIHVEPDIPKVAGQATVRRWKAKEIDKAAFVKAALADPTGAMMAFILLDGVGLNKFAVSTKGAVKYPGIEFYQDITMSSKGE